MSVNAVKLLALVLGFSAATAFAAAVGEVTHLSGTLAVKRLDGTSKLLSVKSEVLEGDALTVSRRHVAGVRKMMQTL